MNPDCWNQIGVWGDRNCPELLAYSHCHNCPVYATAGRGLLEREAPAGYRDELTHSLAQEKDEQAVDTISIGIFRLKGEWLALPAYTFTEITEPSAIHTLPHRSNNVLLGVVSIWGEIHICISLSEFLGLEATASSQTINPIIYQRMVVVEKEGDRWVFPVDEIYGIHRVHLDELQNVPATVSKTAGTYTTAIINWQNTSVSYLDDELLFYTLNKKLL
jgi:chemotaxis-related protein WspD